MKIGILTLPIAENYGGILQAIALYRLILSQVHSVVLIYKQTKKKQVLWKKTLKEILLRVPFHDFKNIKTNIKLLKQREKRKKFHRPFIEKEIFNISKDLYTMTELEEFVKEEKLGAVIVGSDQVWRKQYINDEHYKSYFLDFVDGSKTKKIAYAASFGKDHWEGENDSEDISKLLKDFTAVSVRESSGIDICKNTFDYDKAINVLDPTLLVGKEFYIDELILKYNESSTNKGGLLTYVLDEAKEKKDIIEFVQSRVELENVHHLKGFNNSNRTYTVPQWLASFMNADFVVTDSFHGMVFSIIFEKNFIVIGNKNRGLDRFVSLLSLLRLEERLILSIEELKKKKLEIIDYNRVNKALEINKTKSLEFLINSLNYNQG